MTSVDTLRNEIIGKLLAISDRSYLSAINRIVDTQSEKDEIVKLSEEQKLMLQMSDDDIKNGRTMKEADLNKRDLQWLKELQNGLRPLFDKEDQYLNTGQSGTFLPLTLKKSLGFQKRLKINGGGLVDIKLSSTKL